MPFFSPKVGFDKQAGLRYTVARCHATNSSAEIFFPSMQLVPNVCLFDTCSCISPSTQAPPPLSLILPCLGGFLIVSRRGGWWRLTASSSFLVSQGAVIGIDDEDDSTFTITVDQKTFHFQGESLVFFSPPLSLTSHSADSHVVWSKSVNAAYGRPLACRLSL